MTGQTHRRKRENPPKKCDEWDFIKQKTTQ